MNYTAGDSITFDHMDPDNFARRGYTRLSGTVVRTNWLGAIYVRVPGYGELLVWPDQVRH